MRGGGLNVLLGEIDVVFVWRCRRTRPGDKRRGLGIMPQSSLLIGECWH